MLEDDVAGRIEAGVHSILGDKWAWKALWRPWKELSEEAHMFS